MSSGYTSEQESLKRLYVKLDGKCRSICPEGHRVLGRNIARYANKDYCRKCVESGRIKFDPPTPRHPRSVYFIADEYGNVKIGYAVCVGYRLSCLQTGNASELTLLAEIPGGGPPLERELHERFAEHRVRGEWFRLTPEIVEYIKSVQSQLAVQS